MNPGFPHPTQMTDFFEKEIQLRKFVYSSTFTKCLIKHN